MILSFCGLLIAMSRQAIILLEQQKNLRDTVVNYEDHQSLLNFCLLQENLVFSIQWIEKKWIHIF